jgi:hypothetical protein
MAFLSTETINQSLPILPAAGQVKDNTKAVATASISLPPDLSISYPISEATPFQVKLHQS